MLAQDGLADAQAEAGPAAGPPGGEEGIKNVRQLFGVDSGAIILKDDPDRVGIASDVDTYRAFLPAFADRLLRVEQEVQEHLHQLIGIGHARGYRRFLEKVYRDIALAQRVRLHLHGGLQELIEIDLAASGSRRPGEVLQVLHDFGRTPRLLVQNADLFVRGFADAAFLQQFRHAQNAGQGIIELVGEAADHLPHGRETFARNNLRFQLLLHRHIANANDHARWFAFGIQQWTRHAQHGAPTVITVPGAVFA